MTKRDLARFGAIVRQRREDLGLQQEEMRDRGGPSSTTMSGLERGVIPDPSRSTLRKLDAGLRWVAGSAKTTLDGGDPKPLPPDAESLVVPSSRRDEDPREDIPDMIEFAGRIVEAAELLEPSPEQVGVIVHPAVRFIALASHAIGTKMRPEDEIVRHPERGAAEWIAVYAENLRDLAAVAERIGVVLARADVNFARDENGRGEAPVVEGRFPGDDLTTHDATPPGVEQPAAARTTGPGYRKGQAEQGDAPDGDQAAAVDPEPPGS